MDFVLSGKLVSILGQGRGRLAFFQILYVFGQSVTFDVAVNILLQQVAAVPSKDST